MDFVRSVNVALSYKVTDATFVLINWLGESVTAARSESKRNDRPRQPWDSCAAKFGEVY